MESSRRPRRWRRGVASTSLDRYLVRHLAGYRGDLAVQQFGSGQSNPTFLLSATMQDGDSRNFVLRKKPPGKLVSSAHQVDREMFYVMDGVEGRIFTDASLPDLTPSAAAMPRESVPSWRGGLAARGGTRDGGREVPRECIGT
jgi:aminoglycoside phosphotransferase (APT) family kinase protein